MGELTNGTPKPLLKIGDKTLLERTLVSLPGEIDRVIVVGEYLGHKVEERIKEYLSEIHPLSHKILRVEYVKQGNLKGTFFALKAAEKLLEQNLDDEKNRKLVREFIKDL